VQKWVTELRRNRPDSSDNIESGEILTAVARCNHVERPGDLVTDGGSGPSSGTVVDVADRKLLVGLDEPLIYADERYLFAGLSGATRGLHSRCSLDID
jgi:hypothetical protein